MGIGGEPGDPGKIKIVMDEGLPFTPERFEQARQFIEAEATQRGLKLVLDKGENDGPQPIFSEYNVLDSEGNKLGTAEIHVARSGGPAGVMFIRNDEYESYMGWNVNEEKDMERIQTLAGQQFDKWIAAKK